MYARSPVAGLSTAKSGGGATSLAGPSPGFAALNSDYGRDVFFRERNLTYRKRWMVSMNLAIEIGFDR